MSEKSVAVEFFLKKSRPDAAFFAAQTLGRSPFGAVFTKWEQIESLCMTIHWNTEKLNRHLSRIDGAIMAGRYNLALKLAHRSLKLYYGSYISTNNISMEQMSPDNIRIMAIYICRHLMAHFRKCEIPYNERRLMFITLVSNVIFLTTMSIYSEDDYLADKATATYARENVNSIISYLMRYLA